MGLQTSSGSREQLQKFILRKMRSLRRSRSMRRILANLSTPPRREIRAIKGVADVRSGDAIPASRAATLRFAAYKGKKERPHEIITGKSCHHYWRQLRHWSSYGSILGWNRCPGINYGQTSGQPG